ncbi:HlyD family efflux transporter periplasmic adaptor subunit [Paracoccus cavernae]|uniref:HlyD family efflux transporter periplasmic adaptor subunit n=1 Tax=Paracoccus cavernae TaxID=1571207 RepID=A0ABT8D6L2_9RHOB|nr:HlyD family efflux transporter periplasmic adaptor subunit [Paracoccus cavernae]
MRAQRTEREANLSLAERTFARQQEMVARNASTRVDFDSAGEQVEVLKAQIEALDAQIIQGEVAIETARANVGYTKITAPIDGTVLAIVSQEGQTVNASQAAPTIVILGQLDRMTVRAEISEADIVRIRPGQEVWFNILGEPGKRYGASLETVEPAPESIRNDSSISTSASGTSTSTAAVYYNGVFTVPNPEQALRTYMTAQVYIVLGRAENVLTVPFSAVTVTPTGRQGGGAEGRGRRRGRRRRRFGLRFGGSRRGA